MRLKEGMTIFSIRIPTPSHERLKRESARVGIKPAELIRRAIDEYLDRRESGIPSLSEKQAMAKKKICCDSAS